MAVGGGRRLQFEWRRAVSALYDTSAGLRVIVDATRLNPSQARHHDCTQQKREENILTARHKNTYHTNDNGSTIKQEWVHDWPCSFVSETGSLQTNLVLPLTK